MQYAYNLFTKVYINILLRYPFCKNGHHNFFWLLVVLMSVENSRARDYLTVLKTLKE